MPFVSRKQAQTCYSKKIIAKTKGKKFGWDCDEFLRATDNPDCLPYQKGGNRKTKCRTMKKGEPLISPVYEGPRGGHFFYAKGMKVYVPKGSANLKTAKKMYGYSK